MAEPSLSRKILVPTGYFLSLWGFCWLCVSMLPIPVGLLRITGYFSAALSVLAVNIFCWASTVAYVARRRNWSPKLCQVSGLSYSLVGLLMYSLLALFQVDHRFWTVSMVLLNSGTLAGLICRRIAYPDLTDEQFYHDLHKPLSLFGR
jgi:hypothetical protein